MSSKAALFNAGRREKYEEILAERREI